MNSGGSSGSYSITDLSREFSVTPRTLRFYEEKGLLNPKRSGKNRIYSAGDRTRLRLILRGRQLGLSLEESAEVIGLYAPGTPNHEQLHFPLQKIEEKREQLYAQREALDAMLGDLDRWQTNFEAALKAPVANHQWRQKV